jgi:hypothetical protein
MPLTGLAFTPVRIGSSIANSSLLRTERTPDAPCAIIRIPLEMTEALGVPVSAANFLLEIIPHHALAPAVSMPVLEVISGVHTLSDLTLELGPSFTTILRPKRIKEVSLVNGSRNIRFNGLTG